jgi:hypothetical protein
VSPFETWLTIGGALFVLWFTFQLGRLYEKETYDDRVLAESRERLQRAIWEEEESKHVRVIPFDRDNDI